MKILIFFLVTLSLTSCRYEASFDALKSLESKKDKVEQIYTEELSEESQVVLRDYFRSIKNLTYRVNNNSKMKKYIHKKFSKFFSSDVCEKVILGESYYSSILKKCSVNGFFICSEEVRHYKKILEAGKSLFLSSELKQIKASKKCQQKLIKLGVN